MMARELLKAISFFSPFRFSGNPCRPCCLCPWKAILHPQTDKRLSFRGQMDNE